MKKLLLVLGGILLLCSSASLFAQTYLDVAPGVGTLNSAVAANQGNVIYRLQAGGWYTLNGVIENVGFHLQLIGTTPAPGEMPAAIQTATKPDGTVLEHMFDVVGDLTVKNIFIVNADPNNTIGSGVFDVKTATTARVVFDSIVVDPIGSNRFIRFEPCPYPKLYVTNSLFMRHGNLNGANDWCIFDLAGAPKNGYDTMYVENNTFISTGTHIAINRAKATDSNNVVWINHNTFALHKFEMHTGFHMNQYFVTNNLFFDFFTQAYNYAWTAYSPDPFFDKIKAWVHQDTTKADSVGGVVSSTRKCFVEFNNVYLDPRILGWVNEWQFTHTKNNDGVTPLEPAYNPKLAYPKDSSLVNREARQWNSPAFPFFKFANYSEIDPQWTNSKFYRLQDSLANWSLMAMMLNNWGFSPANVPQQPANAGNWWWCDDAVNNLGNPEVWPRVTGASYTNSTMLTASAEGLPLGDLNWFPAQKALWKSHQSDIMAWIMAENETKYQITSVKPEKGTLPLRFALEQNYPNPFNPSTEIQYSLAGSAQVSLKVFNVLGEEVAMLVNGTQSAGTHTVTFDASRLPSGVYMYQLHAGANTATRKMVLMK